MSRPRGAGDLTARVKFQRRAASGDAYGNPVAGWEDLGISRACALVPTRGGEQVQAGRVAGKASWDCWVRSDPATRTLRTGDRAVDERGSPRTFNIAFIGDMDGGGEWLLIQLTEGGADG